MDGIHDLGGKHGFGPIVYDNAKSAFHEPWQATTFGIMAGAVGVMRNHSADEYRHSIERMNPIHYLQSRYYERVLTGTATLLVEKGAIGIEELEERAGGIFPLSMPVAENPMAALSPQPVARFKPGDRVRVLDIHPPGHTRVPQFCRSKQGTIIHVAPPFKFPDASAHDGEQRKEHTYHVEFTSRELWSDAGSWNDTVVVDLWDSYLEAVEP